MTLFPKSGLQRQLIFYIVFIAIVFLTMAIEMTLFLKGSRVQGVLSNGVGITLATETVNLILLKVGVLLFNLLLGIGLVMMLFSKRIVIPLDRIIKGTRAISNGDFSTTLPEQSQDELGELARRINELAANYQELILLSRNMTDQTKMILNKDSSGESIDEAVSLLNDLDEMLGEFGKSFYQC